MKLSEKGIIVRKTIEDDLPQIYAAGVGEHELKNLPFEFNAENLADIFASDRSISYSAVRKKKVLGFIIGSINGTESKIHWMMVKDNFRKSGIGKELLMIYLDKSKKLNVSGFSTFAADNKSGSLNFFYSCGFTREKTLVKLNYSLNK